MWDSIKLIRFSFKICKCSFYVGLQMTSMLMVHTAAELVGFFASGVYAILQTVLSHFSRGIPGNGRCTHAFRMVVIILGAISTVACIFFAMYYSWLKHYTEPVPNHKPKDVKSMDMTSQIWVKVSTVRELAYHRRLYRLPSYLLYLPQSRRKGVG